MNNFVRCSSIRFVSISAKINICRWHVQFVSLASRDDPQESSQVPIFHSQGTYRCFYGGKVSTFVMFKYRSVHWSIFSCTIPMVLNSQTLIATNQKRPLTFDWTKISDIYAWFSHAEKNNLFLFDGLRWRRRIIRLFVCMYACVCVCLCLLLLMYVCHLYKFCSESMFLTVESSESNYRIWLTFCIAIHNDPPSSIIVADLESARTFFNHLQYSHHSVYLGFVDNLYK